LEERGQVLPDLFFGETFVVVVPYLAAFTIGRIHFGRTAFSPVHCFLGGN
jgi:hypothetical protein